MTMTNCEKKSETPLGNTPIYDFVHLSLPCITLPLAGNHLCLKVSLIQSAGELSEILTASSRNKNRPKAACWFSLKKDIRHANHLSLY